MSSSDLIFEEQLLCLFWKLEQTQSIRDSGTTLRHRLRYISLSHPIAFHQALITVCLFNRIKIGALKIFNEGKFKRFAIINIFYPHRDSIETSRFRCLPTTLACNDLISSVIHTTHDDRLQQTFTRNRRRKLFQFLLLEICTRLIRVRRDGINRKFVYSAFDLFFRFLFLYRRSRFLFSDNRNNVFDIGFT